MSFTFLHTADWQIGRPFGGFPDAKAIPLREARLDCVDRLAAAALAAGAGHVLVAGDVVDSETLPDTGLRELLAKLASHRRLTWHLLPGNHDPARVGGVWDNMVRLKPGPNVRLHLEPAPAEIAPGVLLLPAPLKQKSTRIDPTGWMDTAVSQSGTLRIGLAHGSVQGDFGGEGEAQVPIDAARPKRAGLDYLALGDWHGQLQITERCWYSGTPEPDRYKDRNAGRALVVRLPGSGAPPDVTPVDTGHFVWAERPLAMHGPGDLAALEREVAALGPLARRWLVKLTLAGDIALGAHAELAERLAQLTASLFVLALDQRALATRAGTTDLADFGNGLVRRVADRLAARDDAGDSATATTARRALQHLVRLAPPKGAP